jgi:hypothetical protein
MIITTKPRLGGASFNEETEHFGPMWKLRSDRLETAGATKASPAAATKISLADLVFALTALTAAETSSGLAAGLSTELAIT